MVMLASLAYNPAYKNKQPKPLFGYKPNKAVPKTCDVCGTEGRDVKYHHGIGGYICSECKEAWKDYKGF